MNSRLALVKEYITFKEKDRRLDMLADGESYIADDLRLWETYPEIDIFSDKLPVALRKMKQAAKPRPKTPPMRRHVVANWAKLVHAYVMMGTLRITVTLAAVVVVVVVMIQMMLELQCVVRQVVWLFLFFELSSSSSSSRCR